MLPQEPGAKETARCWQQHRAFFVRPTVRLRGLNPALAERVDHLAQRLGERRVARFEANREALDAQQRAGAGRTRRADRLYDGVEPLAILLAQRAARAQVLPQPREQLTQSSLAHSRPRRGYPAGPNAPPGAPPPPLPSRSFQVCSRPSRLPFSVSFTPSGESMIM